MVLARIRQLAAHEVGHTLGVKHNFAASYNNRASVMDYPAPLLTILGDNIDLSDAYAVGVGEWDKVVIKYAYTEFGNEQDEKEGLQQILRDAYNKGLLYLTDDDSNVAGAPDVCSYS